MMKMPLVAASFWHVACLEDLVLANAHQGEFNKNNNGQGAAVQPSKSSRQGVERLWWK
jgi:hypothetical protein